MGFQQVEKRGEHCRQRGKMTKAWRWIQGVFGNEEETSLIQVHGDLGVFLEGIWVRGEETE